MKFAENKGWKVKNWFQEEREAEMMSKVSKKKKEKVNREEKDNQEE